MSYFKDVDFKGHQLIEKLSEDFNYILNNISNRLSFDKGFYSWVSIMEDIELPYSNYIGSEIEDVMEGNSTIFKVKREMVDYLEYLIEESEINKELQKDRDRFIYRPKMLYKQ